MQNATLLVIRGVVSLLIGVAAFAWPAITLLALVALFAVYAFLDGLLHIVLGLGRPGARDWLQVLWGAIAIAAAGVVIAMPGFTLLWLVIFIAAWAILRGILDLVAAVRLRRVIAGEWLLALSGALSIAFGILVFAYPGAGALTIAWLLGLYAALWGMVLIGLGLRLRRPAGA